MAKLFLGSDSSAAQIFPEFRRGCGSTPVSKEEMHAFVETEGWPKQNEYGLECNQMDLSSAQCANMDRVAPLGTRMHQGAPG